ncbi:MAG: cell wall hydrolase [Geminicoccaceae bacterium]
MKVPRSLAAPCVAAALFLPHAAPAKAVAPPPAQTRCLALALYFEARTEGREGMLAVASVVLNRVADPQFPDTVCGVVKQGGETPPCQFSWWCDGRSDRPTDEASWQRALKIAKGVLAEPPRDRTRGALFFHSVDIRAPWVRPRQRTAQIGRHVFYR